MRELLVRRAWRRLPGWLRRLAEIGVLPSDSEELQVRKAVLVLSSTLMASLAFVWVATYAALGLWVSAAIPFVYQIASALSIYTFARTRRYRLFRMSQLWMSLLLPFALQWSLGGFENSSGVSLWAVTSPLGALLFVGARQSVPWFAAFVGLVAVSAGIDPALAADAPNIPTGVVVAFFALNILGPATTAYVLLQYFVRARERALTELAREHRALEGEQAKSERLLLNVLPEPVAARLKEEEGVIADACENVTVLFADIVGFTPLSEQLSAPDVVALLDRVFAGWDALAASHGVEKIKTIGDAYMAAGGIPLPRADHAQAIAELALAMPPEVARCAAETGLALEVRIGIDTGPVVAGVIGRAKFIYDLWGDTVNTASRMESHALPGTIQVTQRTYEHLRARYELRPRGTVEVKGKGPMTPYLLLGSREEARFAH
ncbi:MAG TPA: adenylate/guanylate cyclase domain-containing protein [Solirubrobacterales bacterium]|nr:adenylate/guanylate cyclase domain-containing protein [Solirubrobacterales bacterium]